MTSTVSACDARILVVDDEPGLRDLLSRELSSLGYTVETACDGVQALEAIHLQNFQLVLCDIKMPRVGGLEVLQCMRQKYPEIEMIMMTGYGTVEMAIASMKCGAYDFIQKPFDLTELATLVEKCLEKGHLRATAALYEASQAVFHSIKIDELPLLIAALASKIFRVEHASLFLVDAQGQLSSALMTTVDDAEAKEIWEQNKLSNRPVRVQHSSLICPFSIDDEPLGVLSLKRKSRSEPFLTSDLQNAAIFSSQIAQAVFNARLYLRLNVKILELQDAKLKIEETQAQLIQSEKLAGIGQMAAGVAHELNNPLSAVIGFTQLLIGSSAGMSEQQRKDLDTVYTQSKRCQAIIQNLLQFCRKSTVEKQAVDVVSLVNAALEMMKHKLCLSGVRVSVKGASALPVISGNAGQLQQVFLNLLTNAYHAVSDRKDRQIAVDMGTTKNIVLIRISDNGYGIAKEIQNKIFEPFFTTKPVGQGTGLGLSICYGIIEQHQGALRVQSELDVGSTFTVELPIRLSPELSDSPKE